MTNVIVCQACGVRLYRCSVVGNRYSGTKVEARDMIPVSDDIPKPKDGDPLQCPKCEELFPVPVGDKEIVLLLEDGSYWPFLPTNLGTRTKAG